MECLTTRFAVVYSSLIVAAAYSFFIPLVLGHTKIRSDDSGLLHKALVISTFFG